MSTVRIAPRARYTVVANQAIEDRALSFRALGLLTYLLSKPDDWHVRMTHLISTHTEGRVAVEGAMGELERAGYVVTTRSRNAETGRFEVERVVHERPVDSPDGEPDESAPSAKPRPARSSRKRRSAPVSVTRRGSSTAGDRQLPITEGPKTENQRISGGTDENAGSSTGSAPPPPEDECSIDQWAARFALTPKLEPEIAAVLRARQELAGAADTIDRLWDLHERVHRLHASELRQALARPYVPSWSRTS